MASGSKRPSLASIDLSNRDAEELCAFQERVSDHFVAVRVAEEERDRKERTIREFAALAKSTTDSGKALNTFSAPVQQPIPPDAHSDVFFCGFLEGDYSERNQVLMGNPIAYSGGFLVRTPVGNILFDPGMGTVRALTEHGIPIQSIDAIVVSHYHPQASAELHLVCNMLGGFTPGRVSKGARRAAKKRMKPVYLLATRATLGGRNDHPALLVPSDRNVIIGDPVPVRPHAVWTFARKTNRLSLMQGPPPSGGYLRLSSGPAFHREAVPVDAEEDIDGMSGREVASFFLEYVEDGKCVWSLFYTGDSEYREELGSVGNGTSVKRPTVLVANTKTIAYIPSPRKPAASRGKRGVAIPDALPFTENQLGWQGTVELTRRLKPSMLVMRALGLECAVKNVATKENPLFAYWPANLAVCVARMKDLLGDRNAKTRVIIPARHWINIDGTGTPVVDHARSIEVFFGRDTLTLGKKGASFVTANPQLIRQVDFHLKRLRVCWNERVKGRSHKKPIPMFLVIQGPTGGGKSWLAQAIGAQLVDSMGDPEKFSVRSFDLGAFSDLLELTKLFGALPGAYTGGPENGSSGILEREGVLILNQLEKAGTRVLHALLDVLEDWTFDPVGSDEKGRSKSKAKTVQPILIFTTNEEIVTFERFPDDLRNRLLGNYLTIPSLDRLSDEERSKEISIVVRQLCEDRRVTLDDAGYQRLRRMSWEAHGSFRALRNVLTKARELVLLETPYFLSLMKEEWTGAEDRDLTKQYCHIPDAYLQAALDDMGISADGKPRKATTHSASIGSGADLTPVLAWRLFFLFLQGNQTEAMTYLRTDRPEMSKTGLLTTTGIAGVFRSVAKPDIGADLRSEEAWCEWFRSVYRLDEKETLLGQPPDLTAYMHQVTGDPAAAEMALLKQVLNVKGNVRQWLAGKAADFHNMPTRLETARTARLWKPVVSARR